MPGICGWAGIAAPPAGLAHVAERALNPRGDARTDHTPDTVRSSEAPNSFLASAHPRGIADACAEAGHHAVIEGHFRFTDAQLAGIAASMGPARALIEGIKARGPRVLTMLDGEFSLAVWASGKRELLLATDRFGIRPVVYAGTPEHIVFGPDANALRLHFGTHATLDPQGIYDYLYFSAVASPYTVWREFRRLESAHYLTWRAGQLNTARYWLPEFTDTGDDVDSLKRGLHRVLADAVARNDADKSAGAFLSGGLDSSTVAGLLSRHQRSSTRTFSIGFDAKGYDEIRYAHIAAEHFGLEAHEYYVKPADVVDTIALIARAYDEPFGNASAVPTYHCARLAAETGVTVLLAGDGGDEIFAGNERYAKQKVFEPYLRLPASLRKGALEPLAFHFPFGEQVLPVRKLRRYIEQARVPLPDRLQTYNPLQMTPSGKIFTPEFVRQIDPDRPLTLLREEFRRVDAPIVDRMLYLDWKFTLADNDLRKVTVMCERAGIDVRYPMLDNAVVEFSTRIPPRLKLPGFRLRHFYREAMRGFLPDGILAKRKHGFGLPVGVWLATSPDLTAFADHCLSGMRKRAIFQTAYLDDVQRRHRTEHAAFYGTILWLVIILECWLNANDL